MVYLTPGPMLSGASSYPKAALNAGDSTNNACMIKVPASCGAVSLQTYADLAATCSVYMSNSDFSDAKADVTNSDSDVIWTLQDTITSAAGAGVMYQYSGVCGAIKVVCTSGTMKLSVCAK